MGWWVGGWVGGWVDEKVEEVTGSFVFYRKVEEKKAV